MDLDLLARTSAILLAASALAALLRRAAPSTRHLVWHLAILFVLLAPILAPLASRVPLVPRVPEVPKVEFSKAVPTDRTSSPGNSEHQNPTFGTHGTIGTLGTVAVLFWFAFCWLLSGLSVWRGSKVAPKEWSAETERLARRIGIASPVVRQSLREGSPQVAGFFTSIVLLPPSAAEWSAESRQAALVHELTHIRRGDRRTQAMAQLACAIYWFNPLVWYAASALARERERACDDEVLRRGAKPSVYASLLLDLARSRSSWTPATALSMARPSAIEGRLLAILGDAARTPRGSTRWIVAVMLAVVATAILGAQPAAAPARTVSKPKAPELMDASEARPSSPITGALVEALKDASSQVREQAAMGLALTAGGDVIDPLLRALKDEDPQVREKAAIGLSFRRDARIVPPLLTAIEDDDSQVREKAAIALGASGDKRAIGALQKAMRDPDSQVREKAVAGLVLLGLPK